MIKIEVRYGDAIALFGISLEVPKARDREHRGSQRRREEHHHQNDLRFTQAA